MTTAREVILNGPLGQVKGTGARFLMVLFKNYCHYASHNWSYLATHQEADTTLLNSPWRRHFAMDCSSLAGAFCKMVRDDLGMTTANVVTVNGAGGDFATKQYTSCFDPKIVGNIRTGASRDFAGVRRCVFSSHVFVHVPDAPGPKQFYDPCLVTRYVTKTEVRNWQLESAEWVKGDKNAYDRVLFKIEGDSSKLLIGIDPNWPGGDATAGFAQSYLLIDTKELNKKDYKMAFHTSKPSGFWKRSTKSVRELLEAAGVDPKSDKF